MKYYAFEILFKHGNKYNMKTGIYITLFEKYRVSYNIHLEYIYSFENGF